MSGINFNPQPINNWKLTPKSIEDNSKQPPQTGNVDDFMQTDEGKKMAEILKNNLANTPKPAAGEDKPVAGSDNPAPTGGNFSDFAQTEQGKAFLKFINKNK